MAARTKWQRASRRRAHLGAWGIILIVLAVFGAGTIGGLQLKQKNYAYQTREEALQAAIDEEIKRAEEIEELEAYTKTKKYVEDVAKEKLGLVYRDEILFKRKNE